MIGTLGRRKRLPSVLGRRLEAPLFREVLAPQGRSSMRQSAQ